MPTRFSPVQTQKRGFSLKRRFSQKRGFSLIEATLVLLIFAVMSLIFAAVFPVALCAGAESRNYSQAAALAQHKVEQIRGAGFTALQSSSTLTTLGIVDAGTGNAPYTASFAQTDHIVGTGSGVLLPAGSTGTLAVCDYSTLNAAVPAGTISSVTIKIQWQGGGVPSGQYQLSTLVAQTPHA